MEKAIVVAYDKNRAIGQNGDLPWGRSLPADLAHFKKLTKGGNDTIYATEIDVEFPDADTFFPEIDMNIWKEVDRVHHPADTENSYDFDFVTYQRKTVE